MSTCQFSSCKMYYNVQHGLKFFSQTSLFTEVQTYCCDVSLLQKDPTSRDKDQFQKCLDVLGSTFVMHFHSLKHKTSPWKATSLELELAHFHVSFILFHNPQTQRPPNLSKHFMLSNHACQNAVMLAIFKSVQTTGKLIFGLSLFSFLLLYRLLAQPIEPFWLFLGRRMRTLTMVAARGGRQQQIILSVCVECCDCYKCCERVSGC